MPMAEPPAGSAPATPRRRRWPLIVLGLVGLPFLAFTLYSAAVLGVSYSDGDRSGVLQKFSRKGWLCKTYEGELAQSVVAGVAPTVWHFSVRDATLAGKMNAALGKRVVLHYEEHRGVPTNCFGETNYFVDSVRVLE